MAAAVTDCPRCGAPVPTPVPDSCAHCGMRYPLRPVRRSSASPFGFFVGSIFLIGGVIGAVFGTIVMWAGYEQLTNPTLTVVIARLGGYDPWQSVKEGAMIMALALIALLVGWQIWRSEARH